MEEIINNMEQAIRLAIEGGWVLSRLVGQMNYGMDFKVDVFGRNRLWCWDDVGNEYWLNENDAFIDPLFWQALGKALGWTFCPCQGGEDGVCLYGGKAWVGYWHRFIDHLASGKDTDSFFKELLNEKP